MSWGIDARLRKTTEAPHIYLCFKVYFKLLKILLYFIPLTHFCACFTQQTGGSILWGGNGVQRGTNWERSSWWCFLLCGFSWLWLCFRCDSVTSVGLTLLRNPHWALSHRGWNRHSFEFKGASKDQQQNCRFNERQGASWLLGTLPTTSRTQKIHLTYLQVHCNPVASQVNLFCTFWMKKCFIPPCLCFPLETTQYDHAWEKIQ